MNYNFSGHQFFFICYPPGAGGSHLSNLISLDQSFDPKGFDNHTEFYNKLVEVYSDPNGYTAHVGVNYIISNRDKFVDHLESINKEKYLKSTCLGHAICYLHASEELMALANKQYIVLSMKSDQSKTLIGSRQQVLFGVNEMSNMIETTKQVNEYIYSSEFFKTYHSVQSKDILEVESYFIYDNNIEPLLERFNQEFGLNIPVKQAQELHSLWIKNVAK